MREILFRGKDVTDGEWMYGYLCLIDNETRIMTKQAIDYAYTNHGDYDGYIDTVISETVGQFTGITDKNGNKIFEGDIIKNEYEENKYQHFKVFYNEKKMQWEVMNKYGMRGILANVIGGMEIIGNIHDNPESLK